MLVVFLLDKYTTWLDPARELGQETVSYLYRLASVPSNLWVTLSDASRSEEALLNQLDRLERENLVLQASLQQMVALRAENTSLRALLNSAPRDRDDVLAAEIIGVSPNPARQLITINQGRKSQVFTGQPVIDADGLLGQVIEVS
ncbi:MAG TPA: rod shape-determining protein MreC, partial [Halieaceae bacterium]|nr:rod shape-determining protein MreC [Halieaceae bacterium]